MRIIGIDPGIQGALAILDNEKVIDIVDLPVMSDGKKNKKQLNGAYLSDYLKKHILNIENTVVVVEQVNAMPGQGVTSMFNFGQSFGVIKGICSAMQLPIHFIRPTKWKKYFNLINTSKDASRSRAIEIFPKVSDKLKRKKDSNKADAILIASYYYNSNKSK